ncbi:MAG: hypothetical protein H6767_09070 [Candidatus Peribacteria bacterium]|nr:MAG: hypothetical protein H6767_09070 [Candidatus Peribacteria bacterium]
MSKIYINASSKGQEINLYFNYKIMNDNNRGLENGDVPGISHQDDIEQAVMSSKGDVEHILLERISSISELMEWLDQLPEG